MSNIRDYIMYYLEIKKKLDIAAARVVNEKKHVEFIAMNYLLPKELLKQKVYILRRLSSYFEESLSYDNAIRSIMYNYRTLPETAAYYNLNPEDIQKEIDRYKKKVKHKKAKGPYEYDKPLDKERIFTFKEELSLMDDLRQWKYKSQSPCSCLICAMVQLTSLAYQSAREKKKNYLPQWDVYQQADREWLINFEMTHSCRLSQLYQYNTVQELRETCNNEQPSSSLLLGEKNIFKVPDNTQVILNRYLLKRKFNQRNHGEAITQTSQTATATISQNNQNACALTDYSKTTSDNIEQRENFDSSQAYNQNNKLNVFIEQKSEVMFEEQTASTSLVTNQFQNTLLSNQSQLLDLTNKYRESN